MKFYKLKSSESIWDEDLATELQIKVLDFFCINYPERISKRAASGHIGRLFKDTNNRELWQKYWIYKLDYKDSSSFNENITFSEIDKLIKSNEWKPTRRTEVELERRFDLQECLLEILEAGLPFCHPVPKIKFEGNKFTFTGSLKFGTKKEVEAYLTKVGGLRDKDVTLTTDYLVIGEKGSENYSGGSYGRKIEKGLLYRLESGRPEIISERDFLEQLNEVE